MKHFFNQLGRRAGKLGGLITASTLCTFAATTGTLGVTQGLRALSAEFSGPLAYDVALAGAAVIALDFMWHRDLGAIGKGGIVVMGGAGLALAAPTLLSMIPGAAAFVV